MKKCQTCKRSEIYFDGCSVVVCPNRKSLTASYTEVITSEQVNTGCYFKQPSTRDDDDE